MIVANSRKLRLIYENRCKDDRVDAEYLARPARADSRAVSPEQVRSGRLQADWTLLEAKCEQECPRTGALRQIQGVGPVTALAFALRVGRAERFAESRQAGWCRGGAGRAAGIRSCASPRRGPG